MSDVAKFSRSIAILCGAAATVALGGLMPPLGEAIAAPAPRATLDQTICENTIALSNGDFEEPAMTKPWGQLHQDLVPGWSTTATDKRIEIWKEGYVPAAKPQSGKQFVELNATQAASLYQDVVTAPGETIMWSLWHRARYSGTDVMEVSIGPAGGTLVSQGQQSDKPTWTHHSGKYTIPPGQTFTRFSFAAVSSSGPNSSEGNFLDNITFGSSACLTSTKYVNKPPGHQLIEVGDTLHYTVATRNDGGSTAEDAVISDAIPNGTAYVPNSLRISSGPGEGPLSDTPGNDRGEIQGGTVTVRVGTGGSASSGGTLSPGEGSSISFNVTVTDAGAASDVTNAGEVSFSDPLTETALTSTSNTVVTPIAAAADLALTKAVSPGVVAGGPITFTLEATNNGPNAAVDAKVIDTLPTGLTNVSAQVEGGQPCTALADQLDCPLGAMSSGATATITVTADVLPQLNSKAITNVARISSATPDTVVANNVAKASAIVATLVDVSVAKSYSPQPAVPGEEVIYTIVVANDGPSTATNVALVDPIDPTSTPISAISGPLGTCANGFDPLTCTFASLAPGQSETVTVRVMLDEATNVVQNTAMVSSSNPDSDPSNNVSSVGDAAESNADISVTKTSDPEEVMAGDPISYQLKVTNAGPSTATNVVILDAIPDALLNPTVAPTGPCAVLGRQVRCRWPELAPNAIHNVTITATSSPDAIGSITNTAMVAASSHDPDSANNAASAITLVTTSADLEITKTVSPEAPVPGERAEYTLVVTNHGPTTAQEVLVTDALVSALTQVETETPCTVESDVLYCAAASLASGQSLTLSFSAFVDPELSGTLANTASVSAVTLDPDMTNNSDTITSDLSPTTDLAIAKTVTPGAVLLGESVTYEITVTNNGPSLAVDTVVNEPVPAGIVVEAVETTGGEFNASTGTWSIPGLEVNEQMVLTITGQALIAETIVNAVTVHLVDGLDPNETNNSASASVTVTALDPETPEPPITPPPLPGEPGNPGESVGPGTGLPVTGTNPRATLLAVVLSLTAGSLLLVIRNRRARR